MEKYDICITGGGVAGVACAYTAGRLGLKTVLVEKNNYLGGLATGGLVVPVMKTDSSDINVSFYSDLISKAHEYGAQVEYFDSNKGWFNPELLKIVLDDMLNFANVDVLFEMTPENVYSSLNKISKIKFSSNLLSLCIEAKYYLDSTGDSKIFKLLGENFFDDKEKKQPASLRFVMAGVDIQKLKDFLLKHDTDFNVTNFMEKSGTIHLTSAYTWDDKGWNLKPIFDLALKNGDLTLQDTAYFQIFTIAGACGSIAFNCPRIEDFDPNDPFDYSKKIMNARSAIFRISNFMKKYFEGFENSYISTIAPITGVRETNKIIALEQFTIDKLLSETMPEFPVLKGDYPIDIHSNEKNVSMLIKTGKYYLGIKSLISKNYTNLYAAGRNLGADKFAQGALRTQASCMSMGEAVAMHVKKRIENEMV